MPKIRDCSHLTEAGQFFKGNLHCHSTASDGRKTYAQLLEGYRAEGYAFLAYSDHEVFWDQAALEREDFILLPAVEWSVNHKENGVWLQTHHVHGIQGPSAMVDASEKGALPSGHLLPRLGWNGADTVQEMRCALQAHGHLCIYNHPAWSRTGPQDFGRLDGYTALEIYNYGCDLENHTGFADLYWDQLLSQGARMNAVATDDNHNNNHWGDSFGGWIMVKAPSLTRDAILSAIAQGRYYSSSGPELHGYGVRDGVAFADCSPCHHINFVAGGYVAAGLSQWSADGQNSLTHGEYKLGPHTSYLRIECVDKDGHIAWSNPIYAE